MNRRTPRLPGRAGGFTMLELSLVLLVIGIAVSMLVPSVASLHHKAMADDDRKILANLKEAVIGQLLATGRLPACLNAGGAVSAGNCDTPRSLSELGIRLTDSRNNAIRYDVRNAAGTDLTTSDPGTVCAVLDAAIAAPGGLPATCHGTPNYDAPGTWTTYCASTDKVAFVLRGTGLTRDGQGGEVAVSTLTAPGNRNIGGDRVFENAARRHSETWRYDDLLEAVTFQQLRFAVNKLCP